MNLKKKKIHISVIYIMTIIFLFVWFLQAALVPNPVYRFNMYFRMAYSLFLIFIALIERYRIRILYRVIPIPVLMYAFSIVIGTYMNTKLSSELFKALSLACGLVGIFALYQYKSEKYLSSIVDAIYITMLVYAGLNLFAGIFLKNGLVLNRGGHESIYFSGGKFSVFYAYIYYLVVSMARTMKHNGKVNRMKFNVQILIGIILMFLIHCYSGLLGLVIFWGIFFVVCSDVAKEKKLKKKKRKRALIIVLIVAFVVGAYLIMYARIQDKIDLFNYIMYDVLNKNLSLDGRYRIYRLFFRIMKGKWIWGYGYSNTVIMDQLHLQNSQNGFFEIILNYGIVGLISFVIMMVEVYAHGLKKATSKDERGLCIATLAVFLTFAIFEVPFSMYFFFVSAMIYYMHDYLDKETK